MDYRMPGFPVLPSLFPGVCSDSCPLNQWCHPTISSFAAAAAKSLQSCPTLCDPIDGSSPGSPVPEILQARTLEWVAISFSNAWKWKVKVKSLSCVWLSVTPWTAAHQAPPSMGFFRQEYWSGVPSPSPQKHCKFPQKKKTKTKNRTTRWFSNSTTGYLFKERKNTKYKKKKMYPFAYCSITYHSQETEAP